MFNYLVINKELNLVNEIIKEIKKLKFTNFSNYNKNLFYENNINYGPSWFRKNYISVKTG